MSAGSIHRTGHNFLGFEIEKDYFTEADKRLREEMAQMRFDFLFGGYSATRKKTARQQATQNKANFENRKRKTKK